MSAEMRMIQHFIGSSDVDVDLIEVLDLFPALQSDAIGVCLTESSAISISFAHLCSDINLIANH